MTDDKLKAGIHFMDDTPDTLNVPQHLRESVFRAYEPCILRAVRDWPQETCFTVPQELSVTTFVARFRDAILSLKKFGWETEIDVKKLWSLTNQYRIAAEGDRTVWFRARAKAGRELGYTAEARERGLIPALGTPSNAPLHSLVPWTDSTQEEIAALCLLLHHRRLTGPFIIAGEIGAALKDGLEASLDVAIIYDQINKNTVIQ